MVGKGGISEHRFENAERGEEKPESAVRFVDFKKFLEVVEPSFY